jgi:Ca2+-transporting ATPase
MMTLLQLAFTYIPFMNRLFHTEPIGLESWLGIIAAGFVSLWTVGLEKFLANRFSSRTGTVEEEREGPQEAG